MRRGTRLRQAILLSVGLVLPACMSTPRPAAAPAFFVAAPQDVESVRTFAREQEGQAQHCARSRTCDRAFYLLALAALYEDRQVAIKYFRTAVAEAPAGPYAASSRAWLRLVEVGRDASNRDHDLAQAAERVVREILERETTARSAAARLLESKPADTSSRDAKTVRSLRRQLKESEKTIHELTQQIDALKRVDREVKDQVKPTRPVN